MMTEQLIKVPDIGGAEGAEVVEVLVAPGESIEVEQSLVVIESDKASMEIPAPQAGIVAELRVAVGDAVSEGDVILVLASNSDGVDADSAMAPSVADERSTSVTEVPPEPLDGRGASESAGQADRQAHSQPSTTEIIDIAIPDLGSDQGADLVEILVPAGTAVEEGDSLVLLESDKASMEVPAPASGSVTEWLVAAGTTVREGTLIARLAVSPAAHDADSVSPSESAQQGMRAESEQAEADRNLSEPPSTRLESPEGTQGQELLAQASPTAIGQANGSDIAMVYAGPAVRKLAREFGISLSQVRGTGSRGRVLKEDLHRFVAQSLAADKTGSGASLPTVPEQDYARFGAIESIARSRIDKVTAANMVRSWLNVPHVTQFDDADISELERFRKDLKSEASQRGVRITPLPFILKACAVALRDHPKLKSSLADHGDTLVMKRYCHIGMAVDTPAGLVVPVIRDVDKKSIWELAADVAELAEKARDKKLKPDDMRGGVFTISSLGAIGGRGFTPIINTPEVAILGVGRAAVQPVWDGEVFRPHTLLPLALSYDHRVVNGGDGGRFLSALTALLADVKRMVM